MNSVFGAPAHVVIVNDTGAGESRLFINGTHSGTWGGNFVLSGDTKVMGARLEAETDHMGAGSMMHSWATYSGMLTGSEIAGIFAGLPAVVAPPATPTISITRNDDGTVTVEFVGVLQAATSVEGPYVDVAADSPLTLPTAEVMQFARSRQP